MALSPKVRMRRLSILFHPHPACPVEGEEFSFPPQVASGSYSLRLGEEGMREGDKMVLSFKL